MSSTAAGLLHDAARQVSLLPDARSIADAAVDQAVRALGVDAAVLVLAPGGSPGPMEVQASVGLHDPPPLEVAPIDLHCIVQLGHAITVADLTGLSPRAAEVYSGVGFAPLEANGAIIGLLGVKQPAALEHPDLELLCGLAAVAAVALEQVRLREAAVASERKRAELERRFLQEKIESLSRVVAGVTHELNTPLGVIAASADIMARAAAVVQEQMAVTPAGAADAADRRLGRALSALDDNAATVQNSVERVEALVRSLQRFARLDEAAVKMIDLHQGLEDTLGLLGPDLGGSVELRRAYGPPLQVRCTPAQVNIVFMALLRNAIQAVAGDGVITVRTWPDGGDAVVAIQDTGRGIEQHDLGAIFSPGFSRWDVGVGTGLGLTTTQAVMERHGGSVAIDSEPGAGTTVTLRFPLGALTHYGGDQGDTEMIKLKVTGMTCGHCEAAVRKALEEVAGVERVVEVSHQRGEVLVEGTPRRGDLVAAVKGEGFEAE
jgi:signal transduction histidine kinase/copper chaperone CopZ